MKRIFATLVSVALLITLAAPAAAAASAEEPSSWAQSEVAEAVRLGFVPQSLQDNYTKSITRGQFAVLAVDFLAAEYGFPPADSHVEFFEEYFSHHADPGGEPYRTSDYYNLGPGNTVSPAWIYALKCYNPFPDVKHGDTTVLDDSLMIRGAALIGLVRGYQDGNFYPDAPISRQEAAVMLERIYERGDGETNTSGEAAPYADEDEIGTWSLPAVQTVRALSMMQGTADNRFRPKEPYTVEQSIVTFARLFAPVQNNLKPLGSGEEFLHRMDNPPDNTILYRKDTGRYTVVYARLWQGMGDSADCFYVVSAKGGYQGQPVENLSDLGNFTWDDEKEQLHFTARGLYNREVKGTFDAKTITISTDADPE